MIPVQNQPHAEGDPRSDTGEHAFAVHADVNQRFAQGHDRMATQRPLLLAATASAHICSCRRRNSTNGVTGADVKRLQPNVKVVANETSFVRAFGLGKKVCPAVHAVLIAVASSKTASVLLSK